MKYQLKMLNLYFKLHKLDTYIDMKKNWEVFETLGSEPGSLNGTGSNGLNVCENGGAMPLPPFKPQSTPSSPPTSTATLPILVTSPTSTRRLGQGGSQLPAALH